MFFRAQIRQPSQPETYDRPANSNADLCLDRDQREKRKTRLKELTMEFVTWIVTQPPPKCGVTEPGGVYDNVALRNPA
jgi:hypothetical protein